MCGFLVAHSDLVSDRSTFSNALDLQSNRGPDGKNFYFDSLVSAGHVRLSIQDLSSLGEQPFLSQCSNYLLVYNGEIFNADFIYNKYCPDQMLRSTSDTEVLLYAIIYSQELSELLSDIEGFFSFVYYDKITSKVIACRDSKGVKPLYFSEVNGQYIFSSDTSSIRHLQSSRLKSAPDIDYASLTELCSTKYISTGNTLYSSIKEVLRGQVLSLNLNSEISNSFFFSQRNILNLPLVEAFQLSVQDRLLSDAPVATLLSGGLDSSLVTAAANSFQPIEAFTVSFPGFRHDESTYASLIAKHVACKHTLIPFPSHQLADIAENLFQQIPYPLVDSSSFPLHVACKHISSLGYKVLLTGDAADEYFCGYPRYNSIPSIFSLRSSLVGYPIKVLLDLLSNLPSPFLRSLSYTPLKIYAGSRGLDYRIKRLASYFSQPIDSLIHESNYLRPFAFNCFLNSLPSCRFNPELLYKSYHPIRYKLMSIDHSLYLPNCLLRKSDLISMHSSVESRSPFLSNHMREISQELLEFSDSRISKARLFKPLLDYYQLDPALFKRPKQGFGGPLPAWIRNQLFPIVQKYLFETPSSSVLFNRTNIITLVDQIENDDYAQFIWSLTAISAWFTYHTYLPE